MRSAARERGNGVRARSWVAERIATGIATGLLTTKRYTPAHSGNLGVEILNEIGVEATRRNALGRPQRFPKPKVGGSSPLGTAKTSTPAGGGSRRSPDAGDPRDLICVCEDWPCRIPRNRMTSGRVCTA